MYQCEYHSIRSKEILKYFDKERYRLTCIENFEILDLCLTVIII